MKNLHRKGQVHPLPPPPPTIADHLSLLPANILTLTAALSDEDKEVLAYLISCYSSFSPPSTTIGSNNFPTGHHENTSKISRIIEDGFDDDKEHDPTFECNCFSCYMCFWARWDKSPNRQLIHEIIEAYEEGLFEENKQGKKNKKGRRKRSVYIHDSKVGRTNDNQGSNCRNDLNEQMEFVEAGEDQGEVQVTESEKGSIRKIVNFIGDSIWGAWNRNYEFKFLQENVLIPSLSFLILYLL